jgi:hypothetical protein
MINSYLESYKSFVKHNGYILEDKVYSTTTNDIAFQAINTYILGDMIQYVFVGIAS